MIKKQNELRDVFSNIQKDSCPNYSNFHCHTTCSDGSLTPIELFQQANRNGLSHLAITDHHSVEAYIQLMNSSKQGIIDKNSIQTKLWSGVEITALLKGCLVHILGFNFNICSQHLKPYLSGQSATGKLLEANSVVKHIHKAEGLVFLAHPARYRLTFKELIVEAHEIGFDGIEVWYDYERSSPWRPSPFVCEQISDLAIRYNMLSSCGTDTHGLSLKKR